MNLEEVGITSQNSVFLFILDARKGIWCSDNFKQFFFYAPLTDNSSLCHSGSTSTPLLSIGSLVLAFTTSLCEKVDTQIQASHFGIAFLPCHLCSRVPWKDVDGKGDREEGTAWAF